MEQELRKKHGFITESMMKIAMSVITVCCTGTVGFLWQINATVAVIKERDQEKTTKIDNMQVSLNQVRMEQQDQRLNSGRTDFRLQNIENILLQKKGR